MGHKYKAPQLQKIGGWPFFGPFLDQKLQKTADFQVAKKDLPNSEFFILLQKSIISDPFYSLIFQKPGILSLRGEAT